MNYIIKHGTKGFYSGNNWIYTAQNAKFAKQYNSIQEAIDIAKTLKSSEGNLLKILHICQIEYNGNPIGFMSERLFAIVDNEAKIVKSHTDEQFTY
jgi:hypothetical protein